MVSFRKSTTNSEVYKDTGEARYEETRFKYNSQFSLTQLCIESEYGNIGKQCKPKSDTT